MSFTYKVLGLHFPSLLTAGVCAFKSAGYCKSAIRHKPLMVAYSLLKHWLVTRSDNLLFSTSFLSLLLFLSIDFTYDVVSPLSFTSELVDNILIVRMRELTRATSTEDTGQNMGLTWFSPFPQASFWPILWNTPRFLPLQVFSDRRKAIVSTYSFLNKIVAFLSLSRRVQV